MSSADFFSFVHILLLVQSCSAMAITKWNVKNKRWKTGSRPSFQNHKHSRFPASKPRLVHKQKLVRYISSVSNSSHVFLVILSDLDHNFCLSVDELCLSFCCSQLMSCGCLSVSVCVFSHTQNCPWLLLIQQY